MKLVTKMRLVLGLWLFWAVTASAADTVQLLNASYDVSRELFAQINPAFQSQWRAQTGQSVEIRQSHGGSSKQARAVADGLPADVVTFNQATDIQFLVKSGLVQSDWATRLPNRASPYYSFPVLLVRAGNPKRINDWGDLVRPGVQVILANPKTSGNGRYAYLAAFAYALSVNGRDDSKARALVKQLLANVPVFDTGGRGAYLRYLYSDAGQEIIAQNFNRVRSDAVLTRHRAQFPQIRLTTVEEVFGSWDQVTKVHFADGGVLDQLLGDRR